MLQYDEYWWNLALRLKPRFKDGKFTFASGVVLREQSPNEFKAIDDAAIKAYQEALAAKTNRKKNTQTLSKLKDKLDSISEKTKETTTAIKKVKVLLQKDKKIESQNVQKTKETLIEREGDIIVLFSFECLLISSIVKRRPESSQHLHLQPHHCLGNRHRHRHRLRILPPNLFLLESTAVRQPCH